MGDARWEGAEWVGDEGRELGKAEWERGVGGGGGGGGGGSAGAGGSARIWDSASSPRHTLQVSLECCVRDTFPWVSRCLFWAGVRRSDPQSQQ